MPKKIYIGSQIKQIGSTITVTEGETADLSTLVHNPRNKVLTYSRTGGATDTASSAMTTTTGGTLSLGSLTAGTYQIELLVSDTGNVATVSAESDWVARSTAAGVVWAHDFRVQREVDQFRVSDGVDPYPYVIAGSDPNNIGINSTYWDTTDGIGNGKCVKTVAPNGNIGFPSQTFWVNLSSYESKAVFPAGTTYTPITTTAPITGTYTFPGGATYSYDCRYIGDQYFAPTNTQAYFTGVQLKYERRVSTGGWVRPFSAFVAGNTGNGKSTPDLGTPLRTYDPANAQAFYNFTKGHYGPTDLHVNQTLPGATISPSDWDGTEFYLQFRVKLSTGRHAKRTPPAGAVGSGANASVWLATGQEVEFTPAGKLVFIQPGPDQNDNYTIIQSGQSQRYAYQTCALAMYTARGQVSVQDPQAGGNPTYYQNAAPYAATCNSSSNVWEANKCWEWPEDEWVTVLYYCRVGHSNIEYVGGFGIIGATVNGTNQIIVTLERSLPSDATTALAVGSQLAFNAGNQIGGAFNGTGWGTLYNTTAYVASVPDLTHLVLNTTVPTTGFPTYTTANGGGFYLSQSAWPYKDHGIKVWVARAGQTSYTAIFDKMDLAFYSSPGSKTPASSINNIDFSCYMNNMPSWTEFTHKYTQVILSKQFINCPQV